MLSHFSHVHSGTLWTVACQAPLSMGFSRQEYWSGQQCKRGSLSLHYHQHLLSVDFLTMAILTMENSMDRGPGGLYSMGSQRVGHD